MTMRQVSATRQQGQKERRGFAAAANDRNQVSDLVYNMPCDSRIVGAATPSSTDFPINP
jgi:hypothetical protein